ncbi:MAG: superfamily helicase [Firmicutes bacterium]|nr:superfamily helicase [Bacillota bacterium]
MAIKEKDMKLEREKLADTLAWIESELERIEEDDQKLKKTIDEIRLGTKGRFSQELKVQEKLYDITHKNYEKYIEARDQPYFGRIDFREYKRSLETFYIGKFGLGDFTRGEEKVVDWRAPIADLYYSGTYGDSYYTAPQGVVSGDLSLKRKFIIKEGELIDAFDEGIHEIILNRGDAEGNALVDEFLKINLEESISTKLKDVVATIQKEQNEVIRAEKNKPLILQGSAGSGKTTVALHRLAYLLYKYKGKISGNQILVLAPNKLFLDYISEVLPDLGIDDVKQCTFEEIAAEIAGVKEKLISKDKKLAQIMESQNGLMAESSSFKGSLAFKAFLDRYISMLETADGSAGDIRVYDYLLFDKDEIRRLYSKDMVNFPLNQRKKEIKRHLLLKIRGKIKAIQDKIDFTCEYMVAREKKLNTDSPERREKLTKLYDERDSKKKDIEKRSKAAFEEYFENWMHHGVKAMYFELFSSGELFERVFRGEADERLAGFMRQELSSNSGKGIIDSDDLTALVYLKFRIEGVPEKYRFTHVAVDEAQDYSLFQFNVIREMAASSSMTIVGDIGQGIYYYKGIKDYDKLISQVFNDDVKYVALSQSYRSTVEIIDFANVVLRKQENNLKPAMPVLRHGKKPMVARYGSDEEFCTMMEKVIREVEELNKKSIAVIGRTFSECKRISEILKKHSSVKWELVKENDKKLKLDKIIIPAYLTKGLEFDCSVIFNCSGDSYTDNELDKKMLYVALTRALHLEYVFYEGEKSGLIS